ncbi:MAG: DUF2141 domain-containing protein [Ignavibacteria bacterium]
MDTNFLGIPSEDYGFSNNAKAFLECRLLKKRNSKWIPKINNRNYSLMIRYE